MSKTKVTTMTQAKLQALGYTVTDMGPYWTVRRTGTPLLIGAHNEASAWAAASRDYRMGLLRV